MNTHPTRPIYRVLLICTLLSVNAALGQSAAIRSGPMVGYGEMTEVMLWIQLTGEGTVQYRYWPEGQKQHADKSKTMKATAENEFIVHTLVTGLDEGKKFEYEVLVNGKVAKRGNRLVFQTQPLWQWRKDPPVFSVALGSCVYVNDSLSDRPGRPYGDEYGIFTAIARKQPDLMLWLGDNTYYREIDWTSEARMRQRNAHTRALPEIQSILSASHNYAIWDDHDYGPNDADRTFNLRREALETFTLFWANHTYGLDEVPGIFSRFVWGDVEFFLLDDRYHRSPNRVPDTPGKQVFGPGQLQWLKESLISSDAPFKIVASGNQMLNPISSHESFAKYSHEQRELLGWIKEQKIAGVVFLSGDRHHTELIKIEDSTFYPLYDFTSSPLTSGLGNPEHELDNPERVAGTLVRDKRNFGLLKFDGPRTNRRLTMECYDSGDSLRWTRTVMAKDLIPKE
ncbi:MAG: alkaline phosphatase D family protein [Bacteroidota bacterium]